MDKNNLTLWEWPQDPNSWLYQQALAVLEWARQAMLNGTFPREDYRELLELIVKFLGGEVSYNIFSLGKLLYNTFIHNITILMK